MITDQEILSLNVTVCAECRRACCWLGQFICDMSDFADTVGVSIRDIIKLNLHIESMEYWLEILRYRLTDTDFHAVKQFLLNTLTGE